MTKSIPPDSIYAGNPAKLIRLRKSRAGINIDLLKNDFTKLSELLSKNIDSIVAFYKTGPFQFSSYNPRLKKTENSLRNLCDATELILGMNRNVNDFFQGNLIDYISKHQCPDGLIYDTTQLKKPNSYNLICATSILDAQNENFPLPFEFVRNINWNGLIVNSLNTKKDIWQVGADLDYLLTAIYFNEKHHKLTQPRLFFDEIQKNINNDRLFGHYDNYDERLYAVNGFYRLDRGCSLFEKEFKKANSLIDTLINHYWYFDEFNNTHFNACNLLDTIYPLMKHSNGYRLDEIRYISSRIIYKIIPNYGENRGFGFDHKKLPSLQGTEMFLSILYYCAKILEIEDCFVYLPLGIHKV